MTQTKTGASRFGGRLFKSVASMALAFAGVSGCLIAAQTSTFAQAATPPFGPSQPGLDKNIFYFSPWGAQLDSDNTFPVYHVPDTSLPGYISYNIYDIAIEPNTPLDFDLFLYTTAPQYANGKFLHSFTFNTEYDVTEYQNLGFQLNPAIVTGCPQVPGLGAAAGGLLKCDFGFIAGPPPAGVAVTNGAFGNPIKLGTFKGITINPGLYPHDGIYDFKLTLKELLYQPGTSADAVAQVRDQFQDVELQRPVPAPLPILGAAAAFGSIRKARKFSSHLKTFSMS
jgi:hypothetical protein